MTCIRTSSAAALEMGIFYAILLGISFSKSVYSMEGFCEKSQVWELDDRWSAVAVKIETPNLLHCYDYFFYKNIRNETTVTVIDYLLYMNQLVKTVSTAVITALRDCMFRKDREESTATICPANSTDFKNRIFNSDMNLDNQTYHMRMDDTNFQNWFFMEEWLFLNNLREVLLFKSSLSTNQQVILREKIAAQLPRKYRSFTSLNIELCDFFRNYCRNQTFEKELGDDLNDYVKKKIVPVGKKTGVNFRVFGLMKSRADRLLVVFYVIVIDVLTVVVLIDF